MSLRYNIKVKRDSRHIRIEAEPNEWSTHAYSEITLPNERASVGMRISWSCGARDWTVKDAEKFFKAALRMLHRAEAEYKKVKAAEKGEAAKQWNGD